jgi:predicted transcriptional regulator
MDIDKTALALNIDTHVVAEYVARPAVKQYISEVFMNTGYRNRFKLGSLLDRLIDKKLEELEEAGLSSNKDIIDIIETLLRFRRDENPSSGSGKQTNIQINNNPNNPYAEFTKYIMDLPE